MYWRPCHEPGGTGAHARPGRRPAPAQAGTYPRNGSLALSHRQGPALGAERISSHLGEAEIAARDASNQRTRLKQAGFPVSILSDARKPAYKEVIAQSNDLRGGTFSWPNRGLSDGH